MAIITGTNCNDILIGTDGNDEISGGDAIDAGEGDDTVTSGAGNDTVEGGAGSDHLAGGEGRDTVSYASSYSGVAVSLASGPGAGGNDWGDTFDGIENVSGSSFNDQLTGDVYANLLSGNHGDDILNGGGGDDELMGGAGNDMLDGGAGNDVYHFGRSDGANTIVQNDGSSSGDMLIMEPGIRIDQIWFERVADDLRVSVIGTGDRTTVQAWYADPVHQLDSIFSAETFQQVSANQVDLLVSAMAAFGAPPAGQLELTQEQRTALDPVLAAAWH